MIRLLLRMRNKISKSPKDNTRYVSDWSQHHATVIDMEASVNIGKHVPTCSKGKVNMTRGLIVG